MQKKICLLGTYAVGKTSLTQRFVHSIFSDRYHSTVGVRIEKRTVSVGGSPLDLIVWDLAAEDEFIALRPAYLRGAAGYILVVDGTRPETLDLAVAMQERARSTLGNIPFVMVANKTDRIQDWALDERRLEALAESGWPIYRTSAKTGDGVEQAFVALARMVTSGKQMAG